MKTPIFVKSMKEGPENQSRGDWMTFNKVSTRNWLGNPWLLGMATVNESDANDQISDLLT